ncbi:MAG: hypothetical protein QOH76_3247 [Thermoleophilaceae bacterium]|nr:hypothetical protein [Thermoleophilaceae bacterium]
MAVLVAGLALLLVPASAGAKKKPRTLTLGFSSLSQKQALRRHVLRVRVRSRRVARVRLFGSARRGKARVLITKSRTLKLRANRTRYVALRLTRAGSRELGGCTKRYLVLTAIPVLGVQRGTGKPVTLQRLLRRDRAACRHSGGTGGGTGGGNGGGGNGGGSGEQRPIDFATPSDASRCDFLDLAVCLQPWPNDYFTVADKSTATGRRLNLDLQSMPRNVEGKPIEPSDYNRNDGFSPGAMIVTRVAGLDTKAAFDKSGIVPITDMAKAFSPSQPVVLINTRTHGRALAWAELDANPKDPADVNLIIRPGRNLQEGTRYVVALRNLRNAAGNPIGPTKEFKLYRDRTLTKNPAVEARRAHMESLFKTLAEAGIDRDSLVRAWDFTTASERNLSERMLAIRDDAFKKLGDSNLADLKVQGSSPTFVVTREIPTTDTRLAKIVEGKILVPCYLDKPACPPGSRFLYEPGSTHGPPQLAGAAANTFDANFRCIVPKKAMNGGARASLYGHGLFGSRNEVEQDQLKSMAEEHNIVFCATEWIGMSCPDIPGEPPVPSGPDDSANQDALQSYFINVFSGRQQAPSNCDIPNVATILHDLSGFSTLTDRVQQGMLDFMYLGRAMVHPDGFAKNAAFQRTGGGSMFDGTQRLFYDGNSQGGIIGGSLIAVEPDLDRGVIGVPGMNYSTLLTRSTDFGTGKPPDPTHPDLPEYAYPLYQSYPNELERPLLFSLLQTLWDRAEANGYALHMTGDPLANTPPHRVLMQAGLGDHQVAQVAAETEARTIGAYTREPYADPGRDNDVAPAYGLPRIGAYPFDGSAFMLFDIGPPRQEGDKTRGTNPPPTTNTPPSAEGQEDPHEFPRRSADARRQKNAFLRIGGQVIDVCGPRPCYAGTWHGP